MKQDWKNSLEIIIDRIKFPFQLRISYGCLGLMNCEKIFIEFNLTNFFDVFEWS